MRRFWLVILIIVPIVAFFIFWDGRLWLGAMQQVVVIESPKRAVKVSYSCRNVSDETRRELEETTKPYLFFEFESVPVEVDRFTASIKCTKGPWRFEDWRYNRQLVVLVEFEDGTTYRRVLDLPKEVGKEALFLKLTDVKLPK